MFLANKKKEQTLNKSNIDRISTCDPVNQKC